MRLPMDGGHGARAPFAHPTASISDSIICICSHSFAISPHVLREFIQNSSPSEGQRAQGMPGARCARSLACKSESSTHASRHGHTGITRHSPRNGLRLIPRSPRGPGSFAPVTSAGIASCENLAPASGRQDHATSPSASSAFVLCAISVHRNPPHVRDDRETPLLVRRDDLLVFLFLPGCQVNF